MVCAGVGPLLDGEGPAKVEEAGEQGGKAWEEGHLGRSCTGN